MEPPRPPFARPGQSDPYLAALAERVLVYDGATGTNLQLAHLGPDDFGGAAFEGCNEILTVTRPDAIETLHRSFLDVGVDVIETDSFGSFSVVLAEYGIPERAHELGLASAQIARRVADEYTSPGSPKFVAGSIGPGTKFPTLGQITYDELSASYEELAYALLEGGVDLFIIETMFDLLGAKAAINKILDSDEGARYIGEFAIGFNREIREPMRDILFDEKIAGSFHFTPGQAYEEADNGNRSQIHWDMVCIQRPEFGGGEIYFDGVLVRKDGLFVLPELAGLNPDQLGTL